MDKVQKTAFTDFNGLSEKIKKRKETENVYCSVRK
jgi:hypothetical protein